MRELAAVMPSSPLGPCVMDDMKTSGGSRAAIIHKTQIAPRKIARSTNSFYTTAFPAPHNDCGPALQPKLTELCDSSARTSDCKQNSAHQARAARLRRSKVWTETLLVWPR